MKTIFVRVLPILFLFLPATFVNAGDFVSVVLQPSDNPIPITITIPGDRFLIVRNLTQEAFASDGITPAAKRGYVSVTAPFSATVLTATILNTNVSAVTPLEPINNVVIAGPATVTITPGDTTCFVSYRKGAD